MVIFLRSSFTQSSTEVKAITTMNLVRAGPPYTGVRTAKKRLENPSVKIYRNLG
jgi:hypothetical protein